MKLENDVEKTEAHIAAMAWYITRIYPWSSCEAPSEQKIKLAAKDTEETSEEIKCLFLVIGLFVVAPAVIIPPAMSK